MTEEKSGQTLNKWRLSKRRRAVRQQRPSWNNRAATIEPRGGHGVEYQIGEETLETLETADSGNSSEKGLCSSGTVDPTNGMAKMPSQSHDCDHSTQGAGRLEKDDATASTTTISTARYPGCQRRRMQPACSISGGSVSAIHLREHPLFA